jgi:hypothetical protein
VNMSKSEPLAKYNHVDLLFPSKYLKAADLMGRAVAVVIAGIDPRAELQMRLAGKEKAWVLNKTNAHLIAEVYGNEVTGWLGKTVVIRAERVRFGGNMVEAVRVDVDATRARLANGGAQAMVEVVDADPEVEIEGGHDADA